MELQLVVFSLAEESFGVPIDQVREIIRFTSVTSMPKAPDGVLGVINLRGKVIPVVSLRERFGFAQKDPDETTRIVVSDVGGQTVGFVVDAVNEVLRISDADDEPAPTTTSTAVASLIKGIGKVNGRLIILLDSERVFDVSTESEVA
jgi:purine-binding chemotaxis protein CheW